MSRIVGYQANLPGGGVKVPAADTGYEPARADHIHQLWTTWEPIGLTSPWENTPSTGYILSVCKISELVMIRGIVRNTGAAQAVMGVLKPEYWPLKNKIFLTVDSTGADWLLQVEPDGELRFFTDDGAFTPKTTSSASIRILDCMYRIDAL